MNDWLGDERGITPRRGRLAGRGTRELRQGEAREKQDRNEGTETAHLDMLKLFSQTDSFDV